MLASIVLRFSDNETNTIEQHLRLIEGGGEGFAYWGWWRAKDEGPKHEILEQIRELISKKGTVEIGLLNRKDGKYFIASCNGVEFADGEKRLPSPSPNWTPEYYRYAPFPAWFRLSTIKETAATEFQTRFGEATTGPETLFAVAHVRAKPNGHSDLEVVPCPGNVILHISDLHFGDFHGFPIKAGEIAKFEPPLDDTIAGIVEKSGYQVGVIVVSGDIVSKGDANGFGPARVFLERLCNQLSLKKDHVVIAPGNHDIYLQNSSHITRDYGSRLPYVDFLRSFYAADIESVDGIRRFKTPGGRILTFVFLNSVRPRSEKLKEYGFIGEDVYGPLLARVSELPFDPSTETRFAIFHHHVILPPTKVWPAKEGGNEELRPISVMLDAGPLTLAMQEARIAAAMHGHHHFPFIGKAGFVEDQFQQPILILGGGSAGAKRDHLEEAFSFNSIGLYKVDGHKLDVGIWKYSKASKPEVLISKKLDLATP